MPEFYEDAGSLPDLPTYLVANEFFDALPIRQFVRTNDGWSEKMVGLENGELAFGLSPAAQLDLLAHRLENTKPDDIVEHCIALPGITHTIGQRIERFGGIGLIIDYGDWNSTGNTFQALQAPPKN